VLIPLRLDYAITKGAHASSVKTSMHRIRFLSFSRSIFAEKDQAHRELISTNLSFWLNGKMQNEILI